MHFATQFVHQFPSKVEGNSFYVFLNKAKQKYISISISISFSLIKLLQMSPALE